MAAAERNQKQRARKPNKPLIALREALGLSQKDFAIAIGRSWPFVLQAESGRDPIGKDTGLAIVERFRGDMDRLGIELEDLLRGRFQNGSAE